MYAWCLFVLDMMLNCLLFMYLHFFCLCCISFNNDFSLLLLLCIGLYCDLYFWRHYDVPLTTLWLVCTFDYTVTSTLRCYLCFWLHCDLCLRLQCDLYFWRHYHVPLTTLWLVCAFDYIVTSFDDAMSCALHFYLCLWLYLDSFDYTVTCTFDHTMTCLWLHCDL